ncbi:MAG: hypothetical protein Q4C87_00460 [Actinomycetaceae bacterium]|nr:hypothetical protein [Actinomycetaceae bacterium]
MESITHCDISYRSTGHNRIGLRPHLRNESAKCGAVGPLAFYSGAPPSSIINEGGAAGRRSRDITPLAAIREHA